MRSAIVIGLTWLALWFFADEFILAPQWARVVMAGLFVTCAFLSIYLDWESRDE